MTRQAYVLTLTKFFHSPLRQISTIIGYDAVWKTKMEDHLFDELNRRGYVTLAYGLRFNPFGKLVNCHQ